MAEADGFLGEILRLFTPLGDVRENRMFGGYGIFLEGIMFALISSKDQLFLKADEETREADLSLGAPSHGKMPYYARPKRCWAVGARWRIGPRVRWLRRGGGRRTNRLSGRGRVRCGKAATAKAGS